MLRERQTQVPGANRDIGGRVVSDTKYDSRGLVAYTYDTWATTGEPSTYAVLPSEAVPTRTRFVRDGAGRVTAEVFEVNEDEKWRTTTRYLGDRTVVDPPTGGTPTSTITDARGRTTILRQFMGSAPTGEHHDTRYSYDEDGNLAKVTDAAGNEWTYTYDTRGRLVEAHDPDKGTTTSTFDDAGQVLTTTDARGKTLAYRYDRLGRATERRSGSASGAMLAEWTYDTVAKGQVSSSTRYSGGDAYTTSVTGYDDAYHVSGQTVTLPESEGELAGSYTSKFYYTDSGHYRGTAYSDLGNLLAENLVAYYDDAGMPLKLAGGGGDGVYVGTTRYTSQGQVEAMDLGSTRSYVVTNDWDEGTRRLMKVSLDQEGVSGTDLAASFSYDAAGNVLKVDNRPTAAGAPARDTQCFDYDGLRRLTSVWTPTGGSCATAKSVSGLGGPAQYWTDYAYDPVGNRTSTTEHAGSGAQTASYSYPAAGGVRPHAVSKVTAGSAVSSFVYDAAGNMVTRDVAGQTAQRLTWDVEGELSKVAQSGESDASFVYTADGDRLLRRQGGATTVYLPGGQELTLTKGGATRATRYYSWAGRTVAVRTGTTFDEVSTLVSDHQGTASLSITNVSAQISRRYQTPFGESRGVVPGVWSGDHGFLDKPADATGLTAVGARYYDPSLGRFVSVDPVMDLTDPQQWHGYAYANNNPVTWSDPTGLRPEAGNGFRDTAAQKKASVRHMARNWTPPKPKPPVYVPSAPSLAEPSSSDGVSGLIADQGVSAPHEPTPAPQCAPTECQTGGGGANPDGIYALVHLVLAIFGMVPGAGEVADGLDAAVCGLERDAACAALAGAGAVPFGGWASGVARVGKNVDRLVDGAKAGEDILPGVREGWPERIADNGKGRVWQDPDASGNANSVRVMEPTDRYPNGYVRFYNAHGQPIGLNGKPGPNSETHISRGPDGSYLIPEGW